MLKKVLALLTPKILKGTKKMNELVVKFKKSLGEYGESVKAIEKMK